MELTEDRDLLHSVKNCSLDDKHKTNSDVGTNLNCCLPKVKDENKNCCIPEVKDENQNCCVHAVKVENQNCCVLEVKDENQNCCILEVKDENQNCCILEVKDENQNCCVHEVEDENQNCGIPKVKEENQNCCIPEVKDEISKNIVSWRDTELGDDDDESYTSESEDVIVHFGEGLKLRNFMAIKHTIHDLVWATKKEKTDSLEVFFGFSMYRTRNVRKTGDADKYLQTILNVCSVQQKKELMMVRNKKYFNHTPLSLACKVRNLDLVKFLVEQCKADINGVNGDGRPMLWAIAKQEEQIVHYLLKMGADPGLNIAKDFNLLLFAMKIRLTAPWPPFGYDETYDWNEGKKPVQIEEGEDSDVNEDDDDDDEDEFAFLDAKKQPKDEDDWTDVDSDEESDGFLEDDSDEIEEDEGCKSEDDVECKISLLKEGEEEIPVPLEPSFRIVKLLVAYGALQKCSQNQLFEIFRAILPEESTNVIVCNSVGTLYERCLPIFLEVIPKIANLRSLQGMTLLGHELLHKDYNYKRCQISSYIEPFLEETDGSDINDANILKYITITKSEIVKDEEETIETNVDTVLKKCKIDLTTNNVNCDGSGESSTCTKFIHPLVFLAASGKTLLSTCLDKPKIPFSAKFDALEVAGANFAKWEYYPFAVQCWDAADEIRSKIITRKKKKMENIKDIYSKWEVDIEIDSDLAENLPCGYYDSVCDWDTVCIDFEVEPDSIIRSVNMAFYSKMKTDIVPDLSVKSPSKSLLTHLSDISCKSLGKGERGNEKVNLDEKDEMSCDYDEDEDEILEKMKIAILLKGIAIHERLIGYGCHQTMRAYHALAIEYKRMKKIPEMVTVITYSFPYLVRYVPQEEYYAVSAISKTSTLNKFMVDLTNVFMTKSKFTQLSFDLKMAGLKCLYLHCFATPKKDRQFSKFAPLLVAIKIMHSNTYERKEEEQRFSHFMRQVVHDDIRNCSGQSLLHYTVPVLRDIEEHMEFEREITGSVELVETLLSFGANPNATDDFGMTPLHIAYKVMPPGINDLYNECKVNQIKIIQTLLRAGAHADCKDAIGKTPISYSETSSSPLCQVGNRQLQCLASVTILKHAVPYKGQVSRHLVKFVELHKTQGKNINHDNYLKGLLTKEKKNHVFML